MGILEEIVIIFDSLAKRYGLSFERVVEIAAKSGVFNYENINNN